MEKCLICGDKSKFERGRQIGSYYYETCLTCGGATLCPREKALKESRRVYNSEYFNWGKPKGLKKIIYSLYLYKDYQDWIEEARHGVKGKILDVGAGMPTFLINMGKRGWDVFAQELSGSQGKKIAKAIGPQRVFVGDFEEIQLPKNDFDVITFWHVLEHLKFPRRVIKKTRDLLTEGGQVYIELPNLDSFTWKFFGDDYSLLRIPEHTFYFSSRSLKILLERNGFRIKGVSYPMKLNSTFSASFINAALKKIKSEDFLSLLYYLSLPFSFAWSFILSLLGRNEILRVVAEKR